MEIAKGKLIAGGIGIAVVSLIIGASIGASTNNSKTELVEKTVIQSGNTSTSDDSKLKVRDGEFTQVAKKEYTPNIVDKTSNLAEIGIDKVTVYKLDNPTKYTDPYGASFDAEGLIGIHMNVKANRDIKTYPAQSEVVVNDTEQHHAVSDTSWDGDFAKGVTKDGIIYVPVKKLKDEKSVSKLRVQFRAHDKNDLQNAKEYDISFALK